MKSKNKKKWLVVLVVAIGIITLGTFTVVANNGDSESEIIGEGDSLTDIWIGEDVEE